MARSHIATACAVCFTLLVGVQQARAATLTVAWDRSVDSTVSGYLVSYGTESHKYSKSLAAGDVTALTVSGLADATIYYVVVQSYNAQGALSEPTSEVVGQTPLGAPTIACPAPVLTSLDGKPISVSLLPVVSGGAAPVTTRCSPASGSLFPVGSTSFACTAVDAIQQTASCSSMVVVLASSSPTPTTPTPTPSPSPTPSPALTIACPVIPPVTATGNSGKAAVRFEDPVASGGKAPVTVSCTPRSGSQFAIGTTPVACLATDALKQTAACTTSVNVLAPAAQDPSKGKR